MYKATLRLPTDQYAYIEVQVEGELSEIVDTYKELRSAWDLAKQGVQGKSKVEKKDERKYDAEMDVGAVETLEE